MKEDGLEGVAVMLAWGFGIILYIASIGLGLFICWKFAALFKANMFWIVFAVSYSFVISVLGSLRKVIFWSVFLLAYGIVYGLQGLLVWVRGRTES